MLKKWRLMLIIDNFLTKKNMFLEIDEMKSVIYDYQIDEITGLDSEVIQEGINAAVLEVKGYLSAANARRSSVKNGEEYNQWKIYDIDAIFGATGAARNAFILRLCKRIAAWNICELANVDILDEWLIKRYENTIDTLEKIAGIGNYKDSPVLSLDLPVAEEPTTEHSEKKLFYCGSRKKFRHE
jgi:phage gp36-like protein